MKNNHEKNFFGKNIRFLIDNPRTENAPKTQSELANKCQFSEGKLSRIINNNVVSEEDALKISEIFNIPLPVLIKDDLEKIEKSVHSRNNISNFVELLIEQTKKGVYSWSKHSRFEIKDYLKNIVTLYNIGEEHVDLVTEKEAEELGMSISHCAYIDYYSYFRNANIQQFLIRHFYLVEIDENNTIVLLKGRLDNSIYGDADADVYLLIFKDNEREQVICEKYKNHNTISSEKFEELKSIVELYSEPLYINYNTKDTINTLIRDFRKRGINDDKYISR